MNTVDRSIRTTRMLRDTLAQVSEEEVSGFVEVLLQVQQAGNSVFAFGAGRANLIIRAFSMRLMQIGFKSFMVMDTGTPAMKRGDLLVVASGSGQTKSVRLIAREAHDLGACVVLFTKDSRRANTFPADLTVDVPSAIAMEKLQSKGSEFEEPLLVLCDSIGVTLSFELNKIHSINEIDEFIQVLHANLQ